MIWIASPSRDSATTTLERRHWDTAEQAVPATHVPEPESRGDRPERLLGLIFLRFAEVRFAAQRAKLERTGASSRRGNRADEPAAHHAKGNVYLPAEARFDYLLNRAEAENTGAKVDDAMRAIENINSLRRPKLRHGPLRHRLHQPAGQRYRPRRIRQGQLL